MLLHPASPETSTLRKTIRFAAWRGIGLHLQVDQSVPGLVVGLHPAQTEQGCRCMHRQACCKIGCVGVQGHREGCMCVICKQARRTGKPWAGMGANGAASQAVWLPQQHPSAKHAMKAPVLRFGKQAYVTATPQLLGGPLRSHVRTWISSACKL